MLEWKPKLRTRYVGLLMNVLEYRVRDDITNKLAAFERTVHCYDTKKRVTMLEMEDMRIKEHLIRNDVKIAEEILRVKGAPA